MVAAYAWGVWAYCASTVMVRGFYALGDVATPVRIGAAVVALNLALNLILIWPLEEAGLGVSTALSAAVEVFALAAVFSRRKAPLRWRAIGLTAARTAGATCLMAVVAAAALHAIPPSAGLVNALLRVAAPVLCGATVYLVAYWLFGGRELQMLLAPRGLRPSSRRRSSLASGSDPRSAIER